MASCTHPAPPVKKAGKSGGNGVTLCFMNKTFGRAERLKSRKQIEALVKDGRSIAAEPLRMIWKETSEAQKRPVNATVAVSKRNFKRAVDRNKLKRRMREAYRRHKNELYQALALKDKKIDLMFFHVSKQMSGYESIETGMKNALQKLLGKL
jgi:ribonuclease P protein component